MSQSVLREIWTRCGTDLIVSGKKIPLAFDFTFNATIYVRAISEERQREMKETKTTNAILDIREL